jgi:hypothetical protein
MKRTLLRLATITLILLTSCGTFVVDGQLVDEIPPTFAPAAPLPGDAAAVQEMPGGQDAGPRLPSSPVSFGLIEIGIILILMVAASTVVGAFFLIRDRKPASDYPQIQDSAKRRKGIIQLLRFKPDAVSIVVALCAWAVLIGMLSILATGALFLGRDALTEDWEPALTYPSAVLVGSNSPHIRLIPDEEACTLTTRSDESEQLLCDMQFEGALLETDVTLEDGMSWYCSAFYAGDSVPCSASFDMKDNQTYVVIHSNLNLSAARYQQLAEDTVDTGWGEQEWLGLARAVVAGFSLAMLLLLWRHSGKRLDDQPSPRVLFRAIYAFCISLITFGAANYISILILLTLKLVD